MNEQINSFFDEKPPERPQTARVRPEPQRVQKPIVQQNALELSFDGDGVIEIDDDFMEEMKEDAIKEISQTRCGSCLLEKDQLEILQNYRLPKDSLPIGGFNNNGFELDMLQNYILDRGIPPENIFSEMIEKIGSMNFEALCGSKKKVDQRSSLCPSCEEQVVGEMLFEYAVAHKGQIHTGTGAREMCFMGSFCEQQNDRSHSMQFDHLVSKI